MGYVKNWLERSGVSALLLFVCAAVTPVMAGATGTASGTAGGSASGVDTGAAGAARAVGASGTTTGPASGSAGSGAAVKSGPSVKYLDGAMMYRVGKAANVCAVTFDDGPSRHTPRLLDILRERNIRATFFVLGRSAERNPSIIDRMRDEGHELANHTYSHKNLRNMPLAQQVEEITRVQQILQSHGIVSRFVRPPFGRFDNNTLRVVEKAGARVGLWSVDSHDWQRRASVERMQSVYGKQSLNGVILFHDTHEQTVDAMPEILDALVANQCRFVTMSEFYDIAQTLLPVLSSPGQPDPVMPVAPEQSLPEGAEPALSSAPAHAYPGTGSLVPPHGLPREASHREPAPREAARLQEEAKLYEAQRLEELKQQELRRQGRPHASPAAHSNEPLPSAPITSTPPAGPAASGRPGAASIAPESVGVNNASQTVLQRFSVWAMGMFISAEPAQDS